MKIRRKQSCERRWAAPDRCCAARHRLLNLTLFLAGGFCARECLPLVWNQTLGIVLSKIMGNNIVAKVVRHAMYGAAFRDEMD